MSARAPAITGLHTEILRHHPGLGAHAGGRGDRTNLPADLTDLVGRDEDLTRLRALSERARLVTLTGPAGVGKTRLAIELARRAADQLDGVWLVDLTALPRPQRPAGAEQTSLVAGVVLAALRLTEGATATLPAAHPATLVDRLAGALRDSRLLLVLDNCEHIIEAVAALALRVLATAPQLRLLATSQEPLRVPGELVYPVRPLDLPEPDADPTALRRSSAVRLFETRATEVEPGFVVNTHNAAAVATICRRLDGIPLAIELAATRVPGIGVHQLADRLDDRFQLLDTGRRGVPERQRTLRAMLDWSWELLDDAERTVLRRLTVPIGGCDLDTAEAICVDDRPGVSAGDVPGVIGRLVDRSLVVCADDAGGRRYDLLESIAAYATERLDAAGETDRTRQRHASHFLALAERGNTPLRGRTQQQWLERFDLETPNLRAALDYAIGRRDADLAWPLVKAMTWYWYLRGRFTEALRSLDAALALRSQSPDAEAVVRAWRAGLALLAGWSPHGKPEDTLRLVDDIADPSRRAEAQWFLGYAESWDCDRSLGKHLAGEAWAEFERLGDPWGTAAALSTLAFHEANYGDPDTARRHAERSFALFTEVGDGWGQTQAAQWLIWSALHEGDYQRATRLRVAATRVAQRLRLGQVTADLLSWQGQIATALGDYPQARSLHQQAIALAAEQGYQPGQTFARLNLGLAAFDAGDFATAEPNFEAVHAWHIRMNHGPAPDHTDLLTKLATIAERRGDTAAAHNWLAEAERCSHTRGARSALRQP